MEALQITTSEKRIPIIRDGQEAGVLVFNPNDVTFAEKFYRLYGELTTKLTEYKNKGKAVEAIKDKDANGLPVNFGARIKLETEVCQYMFLQIDTLFGPGTSHLVFGDAKDVDLIPQFLDGITPHIQRARNSRVERYTNKPPKRVKK